jgi:hypothetical protein
MLLQRAPAGGFRRAIGRLLVGSCVLLVGYGTWAAQPEAPSGKGNRVSLVDSGIRISANYIEVSRHIYRYSGNVIIELPRDAGSIQVNANESQADGSQMDLRGNVRIEVNGRVLTTQHALLSKNILLMDEVQIAPLQDTQ